MSNLYYFLLSLDAYRHGRASLLSAVTDAVHAMSTAELDALIQSARDTLAILERLRGR